MRIILIIALLASSCHAGEIIGIFQPTGRYVETTKTKVVQTTTQRQWYLVSESWCSACPAAKKRFKAKGWPEANILTIAQCQVRFGFRVPHVPFEFGEPVTQTQTVKTKTKTVVTQPKQVMYGSRMYSGRVCSNPSCQMCLQIQRGLQRQVIQYQPMSIKVEPAQEGTPHDTIGPMLDAMQLTDRDVLADLGCGDGRILIEAARRGIRGIGVELDPVRADEARRGIRAAGLERLITIETGDARDFDMSRCTACVAYLYPELLDELAPKMKQVRVAASVFHEIDGFTQVGDVWIHRR